MTRIFVNYRREDCPAHAGRLADTLEAHFGTGSVFMDVATIDLGVDFVERIEQAIGDCDIVLALIGDDWLTVTDAAGKRRLDDPHDFVRLEISTALARKDVRVIPVLVEGAEIPGAKDLPEGMAALSRRNGIELTDTRWKSDTSVLIGAIERTLGDPPAKRPPPSRPAARPAAPRDEPVFAPTKFLWLVPALVGLGGLTLVAFGQMVSVRRWTIAGVLYVIVFVIVVGLANTGRELHETIAFLVTIVAYPATIVHLVTIRPLYLARLRKVRSRAE